MFTDTEVARVCHEANRALQTLLNDPAVSPSWDDAPEWQRDSAVEGVHAARQGAGPEQLHEAWCRHKTEAGWTLGPVKDAEAKTHPCLVPYAELPAGQRVKDALFAGVVSALSA